ncbi:MAG: amidase [Dehalococcoidia bacterium]|nr:amidase [Dehalococcoidia bacterium]
MPVRRPSVKDLKAAALHYSLDLTDEEATVFCQLIDGAFRSLDRVDQMVEPKLPVRYPRTGGWRPALEENPYGAWAWRCSVKGAPEGPLNGKRIALKDVVAVAGVPLTNGTRVMEGFIPDIDASIVTRILDAGGEIVGKAMCTSSSLSAGSHNSYPWGVVNPRKPGYQAGGSSSGSAALVALGEVDMATGGDQGGSIRIPASLCGVVGMKPTFGLVPYTGCLSNEWTVDHVGPMTSTVADCALLLEVMAGPDGLDPRQAEVPAGLPSYMSELNGSVKGLRIGVVSEGFGWPAPFHSDPAVDDIVRSAAGRFQQLGAEVQEVSMPMHRDGIHIWRSMRLEGTWATIAQDPGNGHGWFNYYDTHLVDFYGQARRARANDFSPGVKMWLLQGHYLASRYHGHYYAKAQNLRRVLKAAYDKTLEQVDILLMPTTPKAAAPLKEGLTLAEHISEGFEYTPNNCPSNMTGHPSITLPCGSLDGLPVGLMLTGRHWEDDVVLKAAHAFEQGA